VTLPRFIIEADPDSGEYLPATIHASLTAPGSGGARAPVPMEVVSVQTEPTGMISVTPAADAGADPVWQFDVRILDEALSDPSFASRAQEPVLVTITARPAEGADDRPEIRRQCEVAIVVNDGEIHWQAEGDPSTADAVLHLDADGVTELVLLVRFERYDPEQRRVVYDPETVEFSHWTGPETTPEVFGPAPGDQPHLTAGPSNNRDRTRWRCHVPLPDPAHPSLVLPVETHIRVRAWPRGTVQRLPGAIDVSGGTKMLGEAHVPVVLDPVRVAAELVEPTEPVPADGEVHELVVRILNERTRAPVTSGTYTFELAPDGGGGTLQETAVTLDPDSGGEARLPYRSPQLTYQPGGTYRETLVVHRGEGEARQDVTQLPVHLSPEVDVEISATKPGLEWEPVTVRIPAGQAPKMVRGTLPLTVETTAPVPSRTETFPVAAAEVKILAGPDRKEIPARILTNDRGLFQWRLPELEAGLADAPPERAERDLGDDEVPTCDFDEHARAVIEGYEERLKHYGPFHLYNDGLTFKVRTHRVVFGGQLAREKPELVERIVSGAELLAIGVCYGTPYERMYRSALADAFDAVAGVFQELVSMLITWGDVGEKLAKAAARVGTWVTNTAGSTVAGLVSWVTQNFAHGLQLLSIKLQGWITSLKQVAVTPSVNNLVESLSGMVGSVVEAAGAIASSAGGALMEVLTGTINLIINAGRAVFNAIAAAITGVIAVLGDLVAAAAGGIGRWLAVCGEAAFAKITEALGRLMGRQVLGPSLHPWGLPKAMEEATKYLLDTLAGFFLGGRRLSESLSQKLYIFPFLASSAVDGLQTDVEHALAKVPADHEARRTPFRTTTQRMNDEMGQLSRAQATLDVVMAGIDFAVLTIELILTAVGMLFSVGILNPVTLAPIFKKVELGVGAMKLVLLRLPVLATAIGMAGVFAITYCAYTYWLASASPLVGGP
jgi:hypothetical protein